MKISATVTLGVALLASAADADGGFYSVCNNWFVQDTHYMVANCRKTDGTNMRTRQDLNLCLANDHGRLVGRSKGGFGNTCYGCSKGLLVIDGPVKSSYISCTCKAPNGDESVTTFDLNKIVSNRNGYLWCYGHRSSPAPA